MGDSLRRVTQNLGSKLWPPGTPTDHVVMITEEAKGRTLCGAKGRPVQVTMINSAMTRSKFQVYISLLNSRSWKAFWKALKSLKTLQIFQIQIRKILQVRTESHTLWNSPRAMDFTWLKFAYFFLPPRRNRHNAISCARFKLLQYQKQVFDDPCLIPPTSAKLGHDRDSTEYEYAK